MKIQTPQSDKELFHKQVIRVYSAFTDLTKYEQQILTTMLDNNISELNTESRKQIREVMNTDQHTFNNYISRLKTSGALYQNGELTKVNPIIYKIIKDKELTIEFNVTENLVRV